MLPLLPNPSPCLHTKETNTRQDYSINRASSLKTTKRKIMLCPSESQSSEYALLGAKTSVFACLSIHFSFPILRLNSEAQPSVLPAEGRTRELAALPQPGYQSHVTEGPQSSSTGHRGQGMDQDNGHNFTTPKFKSRERLNACWLPSRRLCQVMPTTMRL